MESDLPFGRRGDRSPGVRSKAAAGLAVAAPLACGLPALPAAAGEAAAACPPRPRLGIAVVAEHRPPAVGASFSLGQLRDAAARSGRRGRHEPLGFYAGVFGYAVEVTAEGSATPGCAAALRARVRMFLDERVVEVGADLGDRGCRPEAVLSHYLLYAEQDDRLLGLYARRAWAMFDRMPRSAMLGAPGRGDAEERMAAAVRRAMDDLLRSYDDDRTRALDAADDDEELAKLRGACGRDP